MFRRLFRRTPVPPTSAANPGQGTGLRVHPPGSRERTFHATGLLAEALRARGEKVKEYSSWLTLPGDLVLLRRLVNAAQRDDGRWQVATTVEARHAVHFPLGVFEFQHTFDPDVGQALTKGFEQFVDLDFPALTECRGGALRQCTSVSFHRATAPLGLPFSRRAVLGPIIHTVAENATAAPDPHPFCPCCFFTHAIKALQPKLREREFFAIRLFAVRPAPGELTADCRVNGVEWEEGKPALLAYAATWPDRGFELRKQYIALQTTK